MNWFFVIAIIVSLIIGFYTGYRTLNLFNFNQQGYFNSIYKKLFWAILLIGSLSFVANRVLLTVFDFWFPLICNLVFALILCFFYGIIIIDIIRLIKRFIFHKTTKPGLLLQSTYVIISIAMFIVGLYMAAEPRIVRYQINIDKPAQVKQLKIVQLSDLHINEITSKHFITTMVNDVNRLKPDYIFITGDTLDQRLKPFVDKDFATLFAELKATYGVFIIFGNHEYYGIERDENNSQEDVIAAFTAANMTVLQDDVFYDKNTGVTLIGRDDFVLYHFGKTRAELSTLLELADRNKPIILLDHQPQDIIEPANLGVDVMFSGHTHAGQIFPMTILINVMYKNAWGIVQPVYNNPFMSIVTSGYGLWGPPIRLMTRAEIVVTELNFQ